MNIWWSFRSGRRGWNTRKWKEKKTQTGKAFVSMFELFFLFFLLSISSAQFWGPEGKISEKVEMFGAFQRRDDVREKLRWLQFEVFEFENWLRVDLTFDPSLKLSVYFEMFETAFHGDLNLWLHSTSDSTSTSRCDCYVTQTLMIQINLQLFPSHQTCINPCLQVALPSCNFSL